MADDRLFLIISPSYGRITIKQDKRTNKKEIIIIVIVVIIMC